MTNKNPFHDIGAGLLRPPLVSQLHLCLAVLCNPLRLSPSSELLCLSPLPDLGCCARLRQEGKQKETGTSRTQQELRETRPETKGDRRETRRTQPPTRSETRRQTKGNRRETRPAAVTHKKGDMTRDQGRQLQGRGGHNDQQEERQKETQGRQDGHSDQQEGETKGDRKETRRTQ